MIWIHHNLGSSFYKVNEKVLFKNKFSLNFFKRTDGIYFSESKDKLNWIIFGNEGTGFHGSLAMEFQWTKQNFLINISFEAKYRKKKKKQTNFHYFKNLPFSFLFLN